MARLSGKAGSVQIGTATATGIRQWSMEHTFEMLETTGFDSSGHREYIPGVDNWAGSFAGPKDGVPLAIGAQVAIVLKESETTGQRHTGSAILSVRGHTITVDGLVEYTYNFVGTGTLTVATA